MKRPLFRILSLVTLILAVSACVHDPFPPSDNGGGGNTGGGGSGSGGGGNGNNDTTGIVKDVCDPDTVYFANDILPLLSSSCGIAGCHDAATAKEGVVMTDYNSIINTGDVKKGKPGKSKLYKVLISSDPEEKMPPAGSGISMSADQINMIYTWISQGAQNNSCNPNAGGCDTSNMSLSADIQAILNTYCINCHSGSTPQGNVSLANYTDLKTYVDNGRLLGSITWSAGYTPMPYGQPQLDSCYINKIKSWINNGAPNN